MAGLELNLVVYSSRTIHNRSQNCIVCETDRKTKNSNSFEKVFVDLSGTLHKCSPETTPVCLDIS